MWQLPVGILQFPFLSTAFTCKCLAKLMRFYEYLHGTDLIPSRSKEQLLYHIWVPHILPCCAFHSIKFVCFCNNQGLLLDLCQGSFMVALWGPYVVLRIKLMLAVCQVSIFTILLSFWSCYK